MWRRLFPVKTPFLLKQSIGGCQWKGPADALYLTFDDGPHPESTPFILDSLQAVAAKATFFLIGNNVAAYPDLVHRIVNDGHRIGNHTWNHAKAWHTSAEAYLKETERTQCLLEEIMGSPKDSKKLFRPPHGQIRTAHKLALEEKGFRYVMWDVWPKDTENFTTAQNILLSVSKHVEKGSIVVLHDSEKAYPKVREVLPQLLISCSEKGFRFDKL